MANYCNSVLKYRISRIHNLQFANNAKVNFILSTETEKQASFYKFSTLFYEILF